MTIRPASDPAVELLRCMINLHLNAFPDFFLTSLGYRFLMLLYRGYMQHPQGICLVSEEGGRLNGFVAGTMEPAGFFRTLLRRQAFQFAFAAAPGLLKNPVHTIKKCLAALFYRGEQPQGIPDAALLSSLAVSPAAQGQGFGRDLVLAFAEEVRRRHGKAIYLITDEENNVGVNRFYERCGFVLFDTFEKTGKRAMNRWVMYLS